MKELGAPVVWGYCGGTVAINTASMTRADRAVVEKAARDFTRSVAGRWTVATTTQTGGRGPTVVVRVDSTPASDTWAATDDTLAPAGATTRVTDATVHLSRDLRGLAGTLRTVTLHELAHAVGADHSTDPRDVMFAVLDQQWPSYTAAEAAGIRKVSGRACG